MNERGFQLDRDGLGILLFTIGAFFAVLLGYSLMHGLPTGDAGGTAALARAWISSLGLVPSLFLCAAMAWIGARLFLQGQRVGVFRTLGRLAAVTIATAILFGAFSPAGGGALGAAIGGKLTQATHVVVGVLAGVAALAFVVWSSWLRGPRTEGALARSPEIGITPAIESDGVSAAEAAALIPEDFNRILTQGRKQAELSTPRAAAPPSPYPEDVRRRGEIPAGARPLHTAEHVETVATSDAPQAGSVYRWTAARTAESPDAAGAHLAAGALDERAEIGEPAAEVLDIELVEPEAEVMLVAEVVEPEQAELQTIDVDAPTLVEAAGSGVQILPAIPRPSWEQSSLFEEGEEAVDAYGTPLSLIESLLEPVAGLEVAEAATIAAADQPAAGVLPAALEEDFEPIEDDDEDEEEDEDEDEDDDWLDDDEEDEDDDEDDDDDLDDDEEEDEEDEDEEEEDDDELDEDEDEEEELEEEDSLTPSLPAESKPKFDIAARIAALEALQARAPDEPQLFSEQETLEPTPLATQAASRPAPVAPPVVTIVPVAAERQIVLQPQAPPRDHVLKAPTGSDRTQLLTEVGCLFVERGRVAVSMLQRQYSMDFDEACKVLDELQELGLIGPYLGGQRRDILLSREQWLEKVASIASS